jgi:hypothetical protein
MAILDKQIRRKTEEITLTSLQKGRVPTAREVARGIRQFLQKDTGPTFRPKFQAWRKVWDYKATNDVFKALKFDLQVANDEVVDQVSKLIRRQAYIELAYNSQKNQIETMIGALRNLLFVSKNTEDSFYGVHDTFEDLSKVDTRKTTRDAVDLNDGVVLLPANDLTADKVDMSHLYNRQSWPITAREVIPGDIGVVQNEVVSQSPFGYAFTDFVQSWRQIVTLSNNGGAEIEFTIPIAGQNEEISISRIGITSSSANEMTLQLLQSTDNVNYTRFAGVPETVNVPAGKNTSIDFETTRVQFVRFILRLTTPTVSEGDSYGYVFGIKNLSFYKMGRRADAELYSLPLTPTGMGRPIDRVALDVQEEIPRACSIDYYVAAADAAGEPREGIWRPITPVSRAVVDGIPKVARFGNTADVSLALPSLSPLQIYSTVRGTDFYQLNGEALEHSPLFHTARLYRGQHSWFRNTQRNPVIREVRDAFVDFTSGDVQNLYAITTEEPDISQDTKTNGSKVTALKVSRAIDYNVTTMLLIPSKNTNAETDQRPRYSVYKIQRLRDSMVITDESVVMPNDQSWKQMANYGIKAIGTGRPIVKNSGGTVTYQEGKDYELELESALDTNAPNVLSGRIKRLTTGSISAGATIKVSYELETDVTYMVDTIQNDKVFLKKDLGIIPDQYFRVTYRFVPKPPSTVRKSALRVTSGYGSTSGSVYQEGPDFLVDTVQGTITRVPNGKIQGTLQVYVDFQYEERPPELDVFTTWVKVNRRDPIKIEFSPIGISLDAGERIAVDGIDVSKMTEFPLLGFGYHQIVVRSRRPEAVGTAAIKLVAQLQDRDGDPVFVSGGKYFSDMSASREPMLQRTYTQLTKNTPKGDHNYFAITLDGYVVVNFEPGNTEEIYTYGYRRNSSQAFVLGTWPEDWYLEYSYALETDDPVEKLLVRALLRRGEGTDGGVTPKILEYHLRLS